MTRPVGAGRRPPASGPAPRGGSTVHLAPDPLAGALGLPAPAVGEAVDQLQAAAAGVLARRVPLLRRAAAGVGHLDPDGPGRPRRFSRAEQHAQHGRTAGVHHRVGDQLRDQQDQRLGQRLVVPYPGPDQSRPRPSAGPPHLCGIRPDLQLNLKHLHRSHHPNRRTHRLAPPQESRNVIPLRDSMVDVQSPQQALRAYSSAKEYACVHTVRRTLRGVEQKHMEGAGIAPRAGPALLTGTRAGHLVRTGAASRATPGSSGSTTTRIQRSVPEPDADCGP